MTFDEILEQAIEMLRRRGRLTYRALKRQFDLDDEYLDDLKEALIYAHPQVVDDGQGLVWTGNTESAPRWCSRASTGVAPRAEPFVRTRCFASTCCRRRSRNWRTRLRASRPEGSHSTSAARAGLQAWMEHLASAVPFPPSTVWSNRPTKPARTRSSSAESFR